MFLPHTIAFIWTLVWCAFVPLFVYISSSICLVNSFVQVNLLDVVSWDVMCYVYGYCCCSFSSVYSYKSSHRVAVFYSLLWNFECMLWCMCVWPFFLASLVELVRFVLRYIKLIRCFYFCR